MVLKIIDICDEINKSLPDDSPDKNHNSELIYDTYGLKSRVKENNSKTIVSEVNSKKYHQTF